MTRQTLSEWHKSAGPKAERLIESHLPSIGVHDTRNIDHVRTFLWALSDYHVSTVSGGVIWLVPTKAFEDRIQD